jgi:hypothetical protein
MSLPGAPRPFPHPEPPSGRSWISRLQRIRRAYVVRTKYANGTVRTETRKFPRKDWLATAIEVLRDKRGTPIHWGLVAPGLVIIALAVGLYAAGLR